MKQRVSVRHLQIALLLVFAVLILGTVGYMLIEHYSFEDALYTTVDMMSTVGNAAHTLSSAGRIFTIIIIILGVGSLFYAFGAVMEYLIEGHFSQAIGRRIMERKIEALRNHSVICGFGRVGRRVANELAAASEPFVIIDELEQNVQRSIDKGYLAIQGNAASDEVLRSAGIKHAKAVIVATDQDANNIYITLSARNLNPHIFIVARANDDETEAKLRLAGANRILSPYSIAGHRMASLALQPNVVDFFDTIINPMHPDYAVEEIPLEERSPLVGKTIGEIQKYLGNDILLLALKKGDNMVIGSHPEMQIDAGDTAFLLGKPDMLSRMLHKIAGNK
ncbi:MAG TPA: potassium channel protein [Ktedonobacteraceae bacterium]|jgi:voltage-gated potassium channel|nr:potassium channel protein [Ktedonobacteraceae bacterium]